MVRLPLCLCFAVVLVTCPRLVAADNEPLVKDLRTKGSQSALTVVLAARPGIPGHAMVILGKEDDARMLCSIEAFGFYPSSSRKAVFGPVPGSLADEFVKGKGTGNLSCRIILKVDRAQFNQVDGVRKKWAMAKTYKVLEADCVTFTSEVAKFLGLVIPERDQAKLPFTFIEKMRNLNR